MKKSLKIFPDKQGYFGKYGGQIIPAALKSVFAEIADAYQEAIVDPVFKMEYESLLRNYIGRPSPLYYAKNISARLGGAKIYLKREDLNHTGAHKINHTLGEALLAKRMGKTKLIAETGAGQHGVALATAAALTKLECEIHMGEIDVIKQGPNVARMKLLGAKVVVVKSGGRSLKDAVDSAFTAFTNDPKNTLFGIGSVVGPHPFPMIVRDFQSIIGKESRLQILEHEGRLPQYLIACVGGGSNAIGLFHEFLDDELVNMIGVEPGGRSFKNGDHAATLTFGKPADIHGMFTYLLQNDQGKIAPTHSLASGLNYPGVGPVHAHLKDIGRIVYKTINDKEALAAFQILAKEEGIIAALESAHAVAQAIKMAAELNQDDLVIINLSGRGDKDIDYIMDKLGVEV